MKTKTCGECFFYNPKMTRNGCGMCTATTGYFKGMYVDPTLKVCVWACTENVEKKPKPPITNGDKIHQTGNRKLAEIFMDFYDGNKCKYCINYISGNCTLEDSHAEYDEGGWVEDEDCIAGFEAWLNAPAESEVDNG